MKVSHILSLFTLCSIPLLAGVEPGELELNKGPKVIATYTNFYNDSDLTASCIVYSDRTAMLAMEGIVPARKPVLITLKSQEYSKILSTAKKVTKELKAPKMFNHFAGIPMSKEGNGRLGALYFGEVGNNVRPERDLVEVTTTSELTKVMREFCGYGDDL